MATTKIQGNASGSGSVTVTAPNTNSNRTLTLPDADVTIPNGLPGADAGYSKNVLSASGDILYASGANTLARLAKPGSDKFLKNTSGGTLSWADAGGGKVLQHVWNSNNTQNSSNTTSKAATGFGVCSITPTKATSIIRVAFNTCVHNSSNANVYYLIYFDTASSGYGVVPNIQADNGFCRYTNYAGNESKQLYFTYDHDHNVTTEINYKVYWHTSDSGNTMRVNYDATYGTLSATEYDVTGDGQ